MTRIAVVQAPPVLLDRDATLERAAAQIDEAVRQGAELVVFPETYLPGYPEWVWRLRPHADRALAGELHARLVSQAIDLSADGLAPLRAAARKGGVTLAVGLHERDGQFSRATLYNTVAIIGPTGDVLNRHRKLVPTNPERMVWGPGDAAGLRVVDSPAGRLGSLVCWENYMPLARFALYAQGVEIYLAPTWDRGEAWQASMRHIAREGRCFVVSAAVAMQARDVPSGFPGRAELYPDEDEWLCPGESLVVDPQGHVLAGPLVREKGLLLADCDRGQLASARRSFDVAGHYGRPDVFQLTVRRDARAPVQFVDEGDA